MQIAVAIVEHEDRFLVGTRAAQAVLAGKAEFPGGKLTAGETPSAAACRECLEETGLAVVAERLLRVERFDYPHETLELHFFLCRLADASFGALSQQPQPALAPFRWVGRSELATLDFPPANAAVLRELMNRP